MKRIGIFGGTFDPPHLGHLAVAQAALQSGEVDEVWLMVSPENPFKSGRRISPEADRLAMARIAVESLPEDVRSGLHVSDFETRLPTPTYTITTLHALREAYPGCSFRIIIGGDNLTAFSRWRAHEEILRDYGVIVYPRPGDDPRDTGEIPPECVVLSDVPLFPYSSTEVRSLLSDTDGQGRGSGMVPEGVVRYIIKHRLYGKN
ncbi:MAG: nicotinate (nicotinamide) nucleotide adenylyltransferase [Muribaculaceae bacterium]|nr:nicotinate (nicotinamide) nucleotide adenylyltransferase [Muribaculaceae bacterium]